MRLVLTAALMVLLIGCTARQGTISDAGLPMVPETPLAVPQQNDQTLRVTIEDGRFVSTIYQEQTGATQLLLITLGGPYLFEIDKLVGRRELAANSQTTPVCVDSGCECVRPPKIARGERSVSVPLPARALLRWSRAAEA